MSADDPSIGVDDTTLVEGDSEYIMDELKNVLSRHREIGSRLHLKDDQLNVIDQRNPVGARAMKAVIIEWLKKNYDTTRFGPPTWKALVVAVANPLGGNNKAEAERIACRHKAATADVPVATLGSTGTHRSPPSDPAGGNNRAETGSRHRAYTVATEGSTGMKRSPPSDPAGRNNRAETEEIGSRHRATTEGSTEMCRGLINVSGIKESCYGDHVSESRILASHEFNEMSRLTLEQQSKLSLSEVARELKNGDECQVNILVTGKERTGKSTLINGLVGAKRAPESDPIMSVTASIKNYVASFHGIAVKLWDTPAITVGAYDEVMRFQALEKNISQVDLVLYCSKMDNLFQKQDTSTIQRLTQVFGHTLWENAIFALTFANKVLPPRNYNDPQARQTFFMERWSMLSKELREALQEIGVPSYIISTVSFIPAGHYNDTSLPNGTSDWPSALLSVSLQSIKNKTNFIRLRVNLDPFLRGSSDHHKFHPRKTVLYCTPVIIGSLLLGLYFKDVFIVLFGVAVGASLGYAVNKKAIDKAIVAAVTACSLAGRNNQTETEGTANTTMEAVIAEGMERTPSRGSTGTERRSPSVDQNLQQTRPPPTVASVMNFLNQEGFLPSKVWELGIFLNVPKSTIDVIQVDHPNDSTRMLMGVIDYWLNNDHGFSWDKLASALEECGHAALAKKLDHAVSAVNETQLGPSQSKGISTDDAATIGVDGTTILNMSDMYDIMKELKNVLAHRLGIGLRLNLRKHTLYMIDVVHPEPAQAMRAVIAEWLKMNTAPFEPPTWKALVAAIAHPLGGNNKAEAERIARKHKAEQPHATLTMADHNKITRFLTDLTNKQLVDLGAELGLWYPHLQRMKTLPGDMVAAWLRMDDNVTQSPSWNTLAAALEVIHQRGIASTIRKAFNL